MGSDGEVITVSDAKDVDFSDGEDEGGENVVRAKERITYLYRVERGLWLNSHAAMCAEIFGIPRRIVKRARYVSHLLSIHEWGQLLDEEMSEEERADLEDAEEVCRRLLAWDFDGMESEDAGEDSVKVRLGQILGRNGMEE